MALRIHLLYPKFLPQPIKISHSHSVHPHLGNSAKLKVSCTSSTSDSELASDLATEMEKRNTHPLQKEEALKKSRELLFTKLCQYLGLGPEEMRKKWTKMDGEEKWVLVKRFVSEWGVNFHPLFARSVREMVEEHLAEDTSTPPTSPSNLFPGLKKIMGFEPNQ